MDEAKIRGVFKLPAKEVYVGGKIWDTPPKCECTRRGGGKLWVFKKYFGLEFEDGQPPELFKLTRVHLEPSWKVYIQKNSFSVPPVCNAELRIVPVKEGQIPTSIVFTEGTLGWEASRAIQFLWQVSNDELTEKVQAHIACNKLYDVVSTFSKLPLEEHVAVVSGSERKSGKLTLNGDGTIRIVSLRGDKLYNVLLDDIIDIKLINQDVILSINTHSGTKKLTLTGFTNPDNVKDILLRFWCLTCNTEVNFKLHNRDHVTDDFCPSPLRKSRHSVFMSKSREMPDTVCFSLREVFSLLETFQTIDSDGNGVIGKEEWISSLGPVFRNSQVPYAVFSVFDHNNDGHISFSEFLFGCRILHLGSWEDRIHYQYRIFDPKGTGWMTFEHFVTIAKTLDEVVGLQIPDIQSYCKTFFANLDAHRTNKVDITLLRDTLQEDPAFSRAFEGLALARERSFKQSKEHNGHLIWFGQTRNKKSQWLECTAILMGIKLSCDYKARLLEKQGQPPLRSAEFISSFSEKVKWEIGSQQVYSGKLKKVPLKGHHPQNGHALNCYESYFVDYNPRVFLAIQQRFGITPEEYKRSLGIEQLQSSLLLGSLSNLSSMASSGKSGAFFYMSHDGRFILKTIDKPEAKILRNFLPAYYDHVMDESNSGTLLTRYFGLHLLWIVGDPKYFLVMDNVMQPQENYSIQIRYDLKGSTVGRSTPVQSRKNNVALKDLDFKRKLQLDGDMRSRLMQQIRQDTALLHRKKLNDYSLLIGIHTSPTPIDDPDFIDEREPFFRRFRGGMLSKDRREIYFVGIIDLLTYFGPGKISEYAVKHVWYRNGKVSCVPPENYKERFVQYVESIFPPVMNISRRSVSPQTSSHFPTYVPVKHTTAVSSANLDFFSSPTKRSPSSSFPSFPS
eukprot:TRINITY_DN11216_c1_g1_i1.p1 TRINITY_DN11216_c1_g1~~TRINITY_DN11216_c1_g1_i1.p1  ORF type:complete len:900 (+),score=116.16 TRINITY_DN11216_c1_g1_i1:106-2805(+)